MTKQAWLGLGFGVAAACLAGCTQGPAEMAAMPPPKVRVSVPVERAVTDYADFTGRTMAVEAVKLRARVWGHLEKINFVEGSDVKKDAVLFVIDQRPYKAALARADSELAQSEARHKRLLGDHKRAAALLATKAISTEEYERISGELAEAAAMVKSAAANKEVARLNLEFTEVRAPISGQVGRAMLTVGNMVKSGENGDTVLTTVMSIDPMYVYFDVDDQSWVQMRPRLSKSSLDAPAVHLGLSNEKGFPHTGKLDFIDNQVDAATGTLRMRGLFPNKDRLLTPGLFVRVRVSMGSAHRALLISDRAIDTDQGQKVVYIVNRANTVEKRSVKLRALHDGLREMESGLMPGESVVVEGIQRVRPGAAVLPEVVAMPVGK